MGDNQAVISATSKEEHLSRAKELGVSLQEYCEAYQLDYQLLLADEDLAEASTFDPLDDFVKINIAQARSSVSEIVCRVNHPTGLIVECHEWPPATLAAILGRLQSNDTTGYETRRRHLSLPKAGGYAQTIRRAQRLGGRCIKARSI